MAEEKKQTPVAAPATVTTATQMKEQGPSTNQFKQAFDQRKADFQGNINSTLDNSMNAQRQGLQNAFNQNMAGQTQATNAGQQAFERANTDLGIQAGRTQNSMNSYADARGLNRQPGSQQALSLGLGTRTAQGKLQQQQQMALQESQRQQELLKTDYQNQITKAVAENDYRRAAALLDDYNNQNNWLEKNAAQMASFGNFAGYEQMYGKGTANTMRNFWIGSNPELAYNTGAIDAKRYRAITGKNPPDFVGGGGGGEGGGGGLDNWWYLPEAHAGGGVRESRHPAEGGGGVQFGIPYKT